MKSGYLIKRFLPYYKKYKWILALDLVCAALTTVSEIVFPLIVRYITDLGANNLQALTMSVVLKLTAVYVILRIIDTAANYYMAGTGHIMGTKMETDMRADLFEHLQKLSYSYYSNTKVGQIMSRITSDLFDVTEFAHHCPEEIFITATKMIVSFCILMTVNIPLTLIVFAIVPFMLFFSLRFRKRMKDAFKASRVQVGELNAQVEDSLLGIRVVKSFAAEEAEIEKFRQGNEKFLSIKKIAYYCMAGFQTTNRFFNGVMYITVVAFGSYFMIQGSITPGDLVAYLLYVTTFLASIKTILDFMEQFQRGLTGFERFMEIMDIRPDITDSPDAVDITDVNGDIEFENVSYMYSDGDENVLENINLSLKAGQSVALVGPSGGGKTTMCNLVPRFYDVTAGRILIDGKDIRSVTKSSLRKHIGIVQQDVYLFSGTIRENVEYGRPGAGEDEIIDALRDAGAYDFVMNLPDGLDTYVGERGVKLSGGQKQRISIARVFLKNPPILILDEATSALDNESERIVQSSLERLAKGRTVITIAHRLTTIKNSDIILVLTENGIEESGTHTELLEQKGIYYRYYNI
ncbi:MAG: ABC transporter ATP-binding protein [Clostridia bacterium]|nr:ABC transporter ATP-binding protein [Clostridia bacterium]